MGIAPTGKKISITSIVVTRWAEGKMVELWENADVLGAWQQLGVIPPLLVDN